LLVVDRRVIGGGILCMILCVLVKIDTGERQFPATPSETSG